MRRFLNFLYDAAAWLAALAMIGVLVMVLTSIIGRLLHFHLPGTDAYAGYSMAAAGFLALAHTLKKGEHIRVTLLIGRLQGSARRAMEMWSLSVAIWPGVMTRLMACPPTCGGAAAILVSEKFADQHGLRKDVRIRAQAMTTDTASTFGAGDMMQVVGFDMGRDAARKVYEADGIGPEDLDVVELHDCFAQNELITYEGLGLCGEGEAARFIDDGDNTYGGKVVTNPSGGLLSKGHPLGATGLAQCTELVEQLRGLCGPRQVESARLALQHNIGIGGACVVTLYGKV